MPCRGNPQASTRARITEQVSVRLVATSTKICTPGCSTRRYRQRFIANQDAVPPTPGSVKILRVTWVKPRGILMYRSKLYDERKDTRFTNF